MPSVLLLARFHGTALQSDSLNTASLGMREERAWDRRSLHTPLSLAKILFATAFSSLTGSRGSESQFPHL